MTVGKIRLALLRRAKRPGRIGALIAGLTLKVTPQARGDLNVQIWQREMLVPADHHLPFTVGANPFWSMPLVHCAAAVGVCTDPPLSICDVGANIGDSSVMLARFLHGQCTFVCIEPNTKWIPYLQANTKGLPVEIIQRFVGEGQLLTSKATGPGTAGSNVSDSGEASIPLDEICDGRKVDLIKVDTDGFDFAILRSAKKTLASKRPAVFFEWDPAMWRAHGEDPEAVFEWLGSVGYTDFCFFSDGGFLHCRTRREHAELIRSLIAAAQGRREVDTVYWDVLAASPEVCDQAIHNNVVAAQRLSQHIPYWNRLQPTFWP